MENITATYKIEIIDCITCNGKGKTTYYCHADKNSTANNYKVIDCRTCGGNGKIERTTIINEIFKII